MQPFVSIIIPCRNEALSLERCVASVLASSYPPERLEILIADGMSDDGSRSLLATLTARDPRVRVLDNAARITPAALNLAIAAARGEFILRVDAHSTIAPDYIATLIDFLQCNPSAWGAGGSMHTEPESPGLFAEPICTVLTHRFGVGNSIFRTGCDGVQQVDTVFNCCWRRDVFQRVGLFHEQLVRSQDIEMSSRIARAGGTLWLVPPARTTYFARTRFSAYLRHNWSNGIWSLLPARYGRLPVRWRHLVPLAFVTALLLGLMLLPFAPALLPAIALPYVLANLAASIHAAAQVRRPALLAWLPITFAGLHLAYGAGSLYGALLIAASSSERPPAPTPSPNL